MRIAILSVACLLATCTPASSAQPASPTPARPTASNQPTIRPTPTPWATPPVAIQVPPPGSEQVDAGCGATQTYKGGALPEWATINAPRLNYVVARPGIAVGYLFSYPLATAPKGNKILWYVATYRGGALVAEGHPLGSTSPEATFTSLDNSWPGEIYPSGPSVPSAGCWHFTLTWPDHLHVTHQVEIDLPFKG
jgi:hypothetical protein